MVKHYCSQMTPKKTSKTMYKQPQPYELNRKNEKKTEIRKKT